MGPWWWHTAFPLTGWCVLWCRQAVLLMLRSLVHVLRGGLSTHLEVLMNDIKRCLQDKNQGLKLDALSLTHTILESHPPVRA